MKVFNINNLEFFKKSLDVYAKQHEAIAQNIAHANDDTYKRANTDFSRLLTDNIDRTLKTTNEKHFATSETPEAHGIADKKEQVDLNREMGELASNQIRYDFATRVLARKYKNLTLSILGRNG